MVDLSSGAENTAAVSSSFLSIFRSKTTLDRQNALLKKAIEDDQIRLASLESIVKENISLKETLRIKAETNRERAKVLSKPPFTFFDILTIAGGKDVGFKASSPVMLGSFQIGTIKDVSESISHVELLSSPHVKNNVFIGEKGIPAVALGKGGGNFEVTLPQGVEINENDEVRIMLNNNLVSIGSVSTIIQNPQSTFINVLFNLPINLYELTYVEIPL